MIYKILFTLMICMAIGCAGMGEYYQRATSPYPGNQSILDSPAGTIAKQIPTLAGNPANINAWTEVLQALGYIVVGAGGKAGVDKLKKKKKEPPLKCPLPQKDSEAKNTE